MSRCLAALISIALVAAACESSPAPRPSSEADLLLVGPIEATLWHNQTGDLGKSFHDLVDEFNRSNEKKITVRAEFQGGYTQIYQKTLAALGAGGLPDAVVGVQPQVADYARAGTVVNLDPYLNGRNGLSKQSQEDVYRPLLDANRYPQYGNQLLSFPFAPSLETLAVNDDVLKQMRAAAPRTWSEFEDVARRARTTGPDGKVVRYGWMLSAGASAFHAWVVSRGGKILSDDGRTVAWDGREGLEALQLVRRCVDEQWCYPARGFEWIDLFGQGNLLFAEGASTNRLIIRSTLRQPLNWSVVSFPAGKEATKPQTVLFGGVVAVLRSTPEKQLALWEFLKWFADTKQTARWSAVGGFAPVRRSAAGEPILADAWKTRDAQGRQAVELIASAVGEPSVRGAQEVRSVVEDMLAKVIARRSSPEEALREASARANQILKENQ